MSGFDVYCNDCEECHDHDDTFNCAYCSQTFHDGKSRRVERVAGGKTTIDEICVACDEYYEPENGEVNNDGI